MEVQNPLEKEVYDFIGSNNVATICCCEHNIAHAFCCFYAFDGDKLHLVFKSKSYSKHSDILSRNPQVSGTIVSTRVFVLSNKGIQFEGTVIPHSVSDERIYYKRLPFAIGVPGELYTVRLDQIKYTATARGRGRKCEWTRNTLNSYS